MVSSGATTLKRKHGRQLRQSTETNSIAPDSAGSHSPSPKRMKTTSQKGSSPVIASSSSSSSRQVTPGRVGRPKSKKSGVTVKLTLPKPESEPSTTTPDDRAPMCPVVGCDSLGHLNGLDPYHVTASGCPTYHNLTWRQCAEMRAREEGLSMGAVQQRPPLSPSTKVGPGKTVVTREPALEGMASPVEIYQFRRAQQTLVAKKEQEVRRNFELRSNEKMDRIRRIVFGRFELGTWYKSNYPDNVACMPTIYVCEFCLAYMKHSVAYERHKTNCKWRHPPGDEIYRKKSYSFFEVDGDKFREYCQNLCLLAKLFLKHKTVHESDQVSPFFFYCLTEADEDGCHLVGYFSKQKWDDQKQSSVNPGIYYNLSCILIMPQYMRRGFGKMLIDFSYELSRIEGRIGSPERPLSDLGLITYRNYWREMIVNYLSAYQGDQISVRATSQEMGLHIFDIVSTLLSMGMIKYMRTEYFILKKKEILNKFLGQFSKKMQDADKKIDRSCLVWTPPNGNGGADS